jgi:YD repeat-containing protein
MAYDAVGQMTSLSRSSDLVGLAAVASSTYTYDAVSRLIDLKHQRGANTLASYGLVYDVGDRLTQSSGTDGTQNYNYDSTDQLTGASHTTQANESYSYDANGNRTSSGYQTGPNNQLLSDGTYAYEYDDEGNRTKRTEIATGKVTQYVWDYRNRLTQVVFKDAAGNVVKSIRQSRRFAIEYTYDVADRRISKKVGGVVLERYIYDGSNIALVFDGQGNQTGRYFNGPVVDFVLAEEKGDGAILWALAVLPIHRQTDEDPWGQLSQST